MEIQSDALRSALLRAEEALREAIGELKPDRDGDRLAMKDLQEEALGMVAQWRMRLDSERWKGRSFVPPTPSNRG